MSRLAPNVGVDTREDGDFWEEALALAREFARLGFDPGTDGSCASTATSTAPGGGCVAVMGRDPWNLEALGGAFTFGADENNAHVQPNGQYHYHGMPEGMLSGVGTAMSMQSISARADMSVVALK
jgi:hypothetical protein